MCLHLSRRLLEQVPTCPPLAQTQPGGHCGCVGACKSPPLTKEDTTESCGPLSHTLVTRHEDAPPPLTRGSLQAPPPRNTHTRGTQTRLQPHPTETQPGGHQWHSTASECSQRLQNALNSSKFTQQLQNALDGSRMQSRRKQWTGVEWGQPSMRGEPLGEGEGTRGRRWRRRGGPEAGGEGAHAEAGVKRLL